MAIVVGLLYAAAIYMMLRRSIVKLVIGLMLIFERPQNFINLHLSRDDSGRTTLDSEGAVLPEGVIADPLPQALILTAIVIAFGGTRFCCCNLFTARVQHPCVPTTWIR